MGPGFGGRLAVVAVGTDKGFRVGGVGGGGRSLKGGRSLGGLCCFEGEVVVSQCFVCFGRLMFGSSS